MWQHVRLSLKKIKAEIKLKRRSEDHTSELNSQNDHVCRLRLLKTKNKKTTGPNLFEKHHTPSPPTPTNKDKNNQNKP